MVEKQDQLSSPFVVMMQNCWRSLNPDHYSSFPSPTLTTTFLTGERIQIVLAIEVPVSLPGLILVSTKSEFTTEIEYPDTKPLPN